MMQMANVDCFGLASAIVIKIWEARHQAELLVPLASRNFWVSANLTQLRRAAI